MKMMMTTGKNDVYIIDTRHNSLSDIGPEMEVTDSYDTAVEIVNHFFLSYGFQLKNGKPYDPGNEDGGSGGFDCFDSVKIHNGKVAEFIHYEGEGPYAVIRKGKRV